jgi:tripartite-type tricarboxylate transporter receptor subunit TctC
MAPAKMRDDLVEKIKSALNRVLRRPEVGAFIKGQGADPFGGTLQEFVHFIRDESLK